MHYLGKQNLMCDLCRKTEVWVYVLISCLCLCFYQFMCFSHLLCLAGDTLRVADVWHVALPPVAVLSHCSRSRLEVRHFFCHLSWGYVCYGFLVKKNWIIIHILFKLKCQFSFTCWGLWCLARCGQHVSARSFPFCVVLQRCVFFGRAVLGFMELEELGVAAMETT
jgi:hypothetical protein